jgi:hypothetical protein
MKKQEPQHQRTDAALQVRELDRVERDIAATRQGEPPPYPLLNQEGNLVCQLYAITDEERRMVENM